MTGQKSSNVKVTDIQLKNWGYNNIDSDPSKKGGGALRRLWEKNFEAIVLVLKIGLEG